MSSFKTCDEQLQNGPDRFKPILKVLIMVAVDTVNSYRFLLILCVSVCVYMCVHVLRKNSGF